MTLCTQCQWHEVHRQREMVYCTHPYVDAGVPVFTAETCGYKASKKQMPHKPKPAAHSTLPHDHD